MCLCLSSLPPVLQPIENDEIIIQIPLKCLITVEMGQATDVSCTAAVSQSSAVTVPPPYSQVGRTIMSSGVELDAPKHIYLMLFMLLDRKKPDSFFKPYYDILPPTLSNMPIFWTEEEMDYLKGSYVQIQVDDRKMAIDNDYRVICDISPVFGTLVTKVFLR